MLISYYVKYHNMNHYIKDSVIFNMLCNNHGVDKLLLDTLLYVFIDHILLYFEP